MPHPADCQVPPVGCDEKHWSRWWVKSKIFKVTWISAYVFLHVPTNSEVKTYFLSLSSWEQWVLNCLGQQQVIMDHEWWRCTVDGNFIGEGWIKIPQAGVPSRSQHDYRTAALQYPLEHSTRVKCYLDEKQSDVYMTIQVIPCYSASLIQ
jgi:hypothetical protein